jgi:hypothetical protein
MPQNLADLLGLGDHGKNTHRGRATRTDQRVDFIHLSNESCPSAAAFLVRDGTRRFFRAGLHRIRSLPMLGLPSNRGKPHHVRYLRPGTFCARSVQTISPDVLTSFRGDMLCQLQQETYHGKGFRFSLEELIVGSVGDRRGFAVLFDADLLQGQRGSSDVLREGFAGLVRKGGDTNVVINRKAGVSPVDQAGG